MWKLVSSSCQQRAHPPTVTQTEQQSVQIVLMTNRNKKKIKKLRQSFSNLVFGRLYLLKIDWAEFELEGFRRRQLGLQLLQSGVIYKQKVR